MMLNGLYAITDAKLTPDTSCLAQVEAALRGGAVIVQYRNKRDDQPKRLAQAQALSELCHRYQRPLLINDDPVLARDCGADGVHLGQQDATIVEARELLGEKAIIGITCHDSLILAQQAQQQSADYVAFGAFFASASKPNAKPAPIELLWQAKQQLQIPVVAIGGISMDNAPQVIIQGADMVAVIQDLFTASDIEARARQFTSLFDS